MTKIMWKKCCHLSCLFAAVHGIMEGKHGGKVLQSECSSAQLHLPRVDQAYLDMTAGRKEDADFAGAPAVSVPELSLIFYSFL
jgi:hypothetical protein